MGQRLNVSRRERNNKKYEFGNKSAIAKTGSGLIVSALAFHGNPYDGHALSAHLEQVSRLTGYTPKEALPDRDYRGKNGLEVQRSVSRHPVLVSRRMQRACT